MDAQGGVRLKARSQRTKKGSSETVLDGAKKTLPNEHSSSIRPVNDAIPQTLLIFQNRSLAGARSVSRQIEVVTDWQSSAVTGGASKARCFEPYLMSWCSRAHFSASFSSVRASWICCIALYL